MDTSDNPKESDGYDLVWSRANALMESLRATGYSLPDAVADLIDNSLSAATQNVWLTFNWAGPDSRVSIADDGSGMTRSTLINAMRMGKSLNRRQRHRYSRGAS